MKGPRCLSERGHRFTSGFEPVVSLDHTVIADEAFFEPACSSLQKFARVRYWVFYSSDPTMQR